ncbi:lysine 2,3-aminomutase [Streptomyces sp. NBC_00250]|uniref:lysine 2,3-aminomutase n=1 Tax=Streptomyces sp. NBC_00250 TaxID=2903641 RepID=UPI002E27ADF0|nr:lysine 2,3-aminomutase [Streptomyces sp. NBC_00250]
MTVHTGHRLGRLIADRTGQPALAHDADVVGRVLPFRIGSHAADELIDWSRAPDDPLYRLLMPHRDLLAPADFAAVEQTLRDGDRDRLRLVVDGLRERLDPHPAGRDGGELRHPYPETLLVLPHQGPGQGRTCPSHCASCFRWPHFTGDPARGRALGGPGAMTAHLARHPEITEVVLDGGDPLLMRTELLDPYVTPLLDRPHVRTIHIRTKAVSLSPQRFLDAPDVDDLLRLLERVVASGRHLTLLLHVSHPRELHPEPTRRAVGRLLATGAVLRTRGAVLRHVNDDAGVWARLWQEQTELGLVPHRMLVERGTGVRRCFGLPLAAVVDVHGEAVRRALGPVGRGSGPVVGPVGGPVMCTERGPLAVDGIVQLRDGPAFALRALRTRGPAPAGTAAYARFDPTARWWDELIPYGPRDRILIPGEPLTPEDVVG